MTMTDQKRNYCELARAVIRQWYRDGKPKDWGLLNDALNGPLPSMDWDTYKEWWESFANIIETEAPPTLAVKAHYDFKGE